MASEIDPLAAYRQAGVDLDISNIASQIAASESQLTWRNRADQFGEPIAFSSSFISTKRLITDELHARPDVSIIHGVDGVGTKPEFSERMRLFNKLGYDLMAMAIDDGPVEGGEAVLVNNCLAVSSLTEDTLPFIEQLFQGLRRAADKGGVVVFTGEIAVHGDRLNGPTDFTVDWMADATGLVSEERVITGEKVSEGDILLGFAEPEGFRCNGISLVRKTFKQVYGGEWHNEPFWGTTLGKLAMSPSTIYSGVMREITGGYKIEKEPIADVHGVAHISGGSIPEKVGRMLKASGLGAVIDTPFDLPFIMQHCQEIAEVENEDHSKRPMSDKEMITTWHGGQGYVLAVHEDDVGAVRNKSRKMGVECKPIGKVVKERGISITSKGVRTPGKVMSFPAA